MKSSLAGQLSGVTQNCRLLQGRRIGKASQTKWELLVGLQSSETNRITYMVTPFFLVSFVCNGHSKAPFKTAEKFYQRLLSQVFRLSLLQTPIPLCVSVRLSVCQPDWVKTTRVADSHEHIHILHIKRSLTPFFSHSWHTRHPLASVWGTAGFQMTWM